MRESDPDTAGAFSFDWTGFLAEYTAHYEGSSSLAALITVEMIGETTLRKIFDRLMVDSGTESPLGRVLCRLLGFLRPRIVQEWCISEYDSLATPELRCKLIDVLGFVGNDRGLEFLLSQSTSDDERILLSVASSLRRLAENSVIEFSAARRKAISQALGGSLSRMNQELNTQPKKNWGGPQSTQKIESVHFVSDAELVAIKSGLLSLNLTLEELGQAILDGDDQTFSQAIATQLVGKGKLRSAFNEFISGYPASPSGELILNFFWYLRPPIVMDWCLHEYAVNPDRNYKLNALTLLRFVSTPVILDELLSLFASNDNAVLNQVINILEQIEFGGGSFSALEKNRIVEVMSQHPAEGVREWANNPFPTSR